MERLPTEHGSFQINLFAAQSKEHPQENVVISPLSAYQVLCLTANGAANATLQSMLSALSGKHCTELNQINKKILDFSKNFKSCSIANAVMTKFVPKTDFINKTKIYDALVEELKTTQQVNKWCSTKTKGCIPSIIDKIDERTKMILLNAVYFKDNWTVKFNPKETKDFNFNNFDLSQSKIKMMNIEEKFLYSSSNGNQIIELPYKNDDMSAIVILPQLGKDINSFVESLDQTTLSQMVGSLRENKVKLSLPKFELKYSSTLNSSLISLGMGPAFSEDNADFSAMRTENDLYISDVIHKTLIQVNESGTKAAAVTAVVVKARGCMPHAEPKVYKMIVDRPFLFLIRNKKLPENNQMVFMCKIGKL
ncbi:MAG: hypothetical protein MJ252_00205 [archaeon]|nr:hypothetical protein [archaeon]